MMAIKVVPALSDNYVYLIECQKGLICIDPGEPIDIDQNLIAILNTHHHSDHIDGNMAMKERYKCPLIAPDDERISDVDQIAKEGQPVEVDKRAFDVLHVPGHTKTHIAYYSKELNAVFTGDSLFVCGCGKLLEGTAEEMFHSLKKLGRLPQSTHVYCGHEYTKTNLNFALSIEPDNQLLLSKLKNLSIPSVPSTIEEELKTNPFLRTNDPAIRKSLDMADAEELEVFARLRQLKDVF